MAGDLTAFAHVRDRTVERLGRRSSLPQGARSRTIAARNRHEQAILSDKFVASLGCRCLRRIQNPHEIRRDLGLPRAGSLNLEVARDLGVDRTLRDRRVAAGGPDQA